MSNEAARTLSAMVAEVAERLGWDVTARCCRKMSESSFVSLPERLPTREEAALAATIIRRCNGHDLDVWTDGQFSDEDDWLLALSKITTPST